MAGKGNRISFGKNIKLKNVDINCEYGANVFISDDCKLNNVNIDPKQMKHIEAIILSMTKEERQNPNILKASRKQRIAKGSGRTVTEVNALLNQFEQMKQMMKMVSNGNFKMPF